MTKKFHKLETNPCRNDAKYSMFLTSIKVPFSLHFICDQLWENWQYCFFFCFFFKREAITNISTQ